MCKSEIFFNLLVLTERETEVHGRQICACQAALGSRPVSRPDSGDDQPHGAGSTAPAGAEHHLADDRNISGTNKETHQNRTLDGARVVEYVCTTVGLVTGTTKYKYNYE